MMLAVLPRRHADELGGELFVAAYERQLSVYPNQAISHLCDEAIRTQKWFPTVADCIEMIGSWRREDETTRRRSLANRLAYNERRARAVPKKPAEPWTPAPGELEAIKRQVAESLKAERA